MHPVSVFEIFKIGIGPSSSHTLGPWMAARSFCLQLISENLINKLSRIQISLYGSLALTGKGHGSDVALILGLTGADPETIPLNLIQEIPASVRQLKVIRIGDKLSISFNIENDILYFYDQFLAKHANGMESTAYTKSGDILMEKTYFSIGGGSIVEDGITENEDDEGDKKKHNLLFAKELNDQCEIQRCDISRLAMENETINSSRTEVIDKLLQIWSVMKECVYRGCHIEGELPGGLGVKRRAALIHNKLFKNRIISKDQWLQNLIDENYSFHQTNKWVSCFAMAVNEENASFSRVVTAPTNGAAGVIPAVIMYFICFEKKKEEPEDIVRFLLTAGVVGSMFKQRATISAAMGGCQAEIGVSSAMAAAGLTECLGGSPGQCLMAAEIAMEHHLGLTCDPIAGLVQIPCIERNTMGAVKAITAAHLALESDPSQAKVSLDDIVDTMWETAQDMHSKYKETSMGGLAKKVRVNVPEC